MPKLPRRAFLSQSLISSADFASSSLAISSALQSSPPQALAPSDHLGIFATESAAQAVARSIQGTSTVDDYRRIAEHSRMLSRHFKESGLNEHVKSMAATYLANGTALPTDLSTALDWSSTVQLVQKYAPSFTEADFRNRSQLRVDTVAAQNYLKQASLLGASHAFDDLADKFEMMASAGDLPAHVAGLAENEARLQRVCAFDKALCMIVTAIGFLLILSAVAAGCIIGGPATAAACAILGSNFSLLTFGALAGLMIYLCGILADAPARPLSAATMMST